MTNRFIPLAALLLCNAASAAPDSQPHWTTQQIERLRDWLRNAPQEGLVLPAVPGTANAFDTGDAAQIDRAMTDLALTLARAYLLGSSGPGARAGWRIQGNDESIDLSVRLSAALARDDVDGFYADLRPRNSDYQALRNALERDEDWLNRKGIPKRRIF